MNQDKIYNIPVVWTYGRPLPSGFVVTGVGETAQKERKFITMTFSIEHWELAIRDLIDKATISGTVLRYLCVDSVLKERL